MSDSYLMLYLYIILKTHADTWTHNTRQKLSDSGKVDTCCVVLRPEPIMLKILPINLSRISQKISLLFFLLFLYPAYYSIIILIQYIPVASHLVFKMLL